MQENNVMPLTGVPNTSEPFGKIPNDAENFGRIPNGSERFRTVPKGAERKEEHTLTVREVARLFEAAGVARTERSITNWCQPTRTGIARLDSYFDPNERRYYITTQSVEQAIAEEKTKAAKNNESSESVGSVPQGAESVRRTNQPGDDESRIKELERENLDLKITNRAKDMEIERVHEERKSFFDQLLSASRKIGELENKLLQIESPQSSQNQVEQ